VIDFMDEAVDIE